MRSSVATASQSRLQAIKNLNQKYEATQYIDHVMDGLHIESIHF